MKYILTGIFFRFIFCISDASFAAESSIIPFQIVPDSKPLIHLGGLQDGNGVNLVSGLQIQPTKNLLLGGVVPVQPPELAVYVKLYLLLSPVFCSKINLLSLYSVTLLVAGSNV